jgi:hypothetical protein
LRIADCGLRIADCGLIKLLISISGPRVEQVPKSAIRNPQSAIRNPTPSIDNPNTRFYSSLAKGTSAGGLKIAVFNKPSTPHRRK